MHHWPVGLRNELALCFLCNRNCVFKYWNRLTIFHVLITSDATTCIQLVYCDMTIMMSYFALVYTCYIPMALSPSKPNIRQAGQNSPPPPLVINLTVYQCIFKNTPLAFILSRLVPIHVISPKFSDIYFNVILPSTSGWVRIQPVPSKSFKFIIN
jgi:hypothetical protein